MWPAAEPECVLMQCCLDLRQPLPERIGLGLVVHSAGGQVLLVALLPAVDHAAVEEVGDGGGDADQNAACTAELLSLALALGGAK